MSKLRVHTFSISIDGYGAGPSQDLQHPLGVGGEAMFDWFFHTRTWRRMHGEQDGETGPDDTVAARGFDGIGAWILGRNMFGPVRGAWPDDAWKGWWGDEPPYHTPAFVLTHHPRAPAPSFISSPAAFTPRCSRRGKRPADATSGWVAACRRSANICKPG